MTSFLKVSCSWSCCRPPGGNGNIKVMPRQLLEFHEVWFQLIEYNKYIGFWVKKMHIWWTTNMVVLTWCPVGPLHIAWYSMELLGIVWYFIVVVILSCMILHGILWYCVVLHFCCDIILYDIAWYLWYCVVLHCCYMIHCMILHGFHHILMYFPVYSAWIKWLRGLIADVAPS